MLKIICNLGQHTCSSQCDFCRTTPRDVNPPDYSNLSATFYSIHNDTTNGNFNSLMFKLLTVVESDWIQYNRSTLEIPKQVLLTFNSLQPDAEKYFDFPAELHKNNISTRGRNGLIPVILMSLQTLINSTPCADAKIIRKIFLQKAIFQLLVDITTQQELKHYN
jgi:hypothetical protein